jgi:hypothetical protein
VAEINSLLPEPLGHGHESNVLRLFRTELGFSHRRLDRNGPLASLVEEEGIEPSFAGCRPAVLPLNDSPKLTATLARRAQSLNVERNLADPWVGVDSVVEECLRRFRFTLNLPDPGVRHIIRFLLERGDEGRTEPLDAIVRLSREVAIIERDEMSTFVPSISGFFRVLAVTPIKCEHVLTTFPGPVLELDADAGILQPFEHCYSDFVTEAIPKLKPVEWLYSACGKARGGASARSRRHSLSTHEILAHGRGSMPHRKRKHGRVRHDAPRHRKEIPCAESNRTSVRSR